MLELFFLTLFLVGLVLGCLFLYLLVAIVVKLFSIRISVLVGIAVCVFIAYVANKLFL